MADPPHRPMVELEAEWPPPVMIRPDYRPVFTVPPPAPSKAPPGLKRLGWVQTFVLAGIALLAAGWKAHDIIADYPVRTEVASMCASQVAAERQVREEMSTKVQARLGELEDAGARSVAGVSAVAKRVDVLEKRLGVRPVVAPPLP